jgi:hypothetical protein
LFHAPRNEGRGESRVPIAPTVAHRNARVTTGSTGSSGFPCAMVYGLWRVLPGVTSSVAPVASGLTMHLNPVGPKCISQNLTPAWGAGTTRFCSSAPISAKALAGPRAVRQVPAETVGSVVRPHAGRSLTERSALRSLAHPTLSRPSHPTRVRDDSRSAPSRVRRANK